MFSGPNSIGLVWSGVEQGLMQFMQFVVIFATAVFLATLWYPL